MSRRLEELMSRWNIVRIDLQMNGTPIFQAISKESGEVVLQRDSVPDLVKALEEYEEFAKKWDSKFGNEG